MADKQPFVTHLYTADPSAHVFNGKLYVYPSHDRETDIKNNDNGDQYDMNDYHVFSMDDVGGPVTDHGVALKAEDVPWVSRQLWAPDAASKNGKYYLYFPARDQEDIFRVGVAVGDTPEGPFKAEPEYIKGTFSVDPAVFVDDDGQAYLYFGGLWGGQLQCYANGAFDKSQLGANEPSTGSALHAKVAKLSDDMLSLASPVSDVVIQDPSTGKPIAAEDHARRFFEAAWLHKYNGKYYFSYSTGDTHYLAYAIGDTPLGPFTYGGRILEPVIGWTTHHSIAEFKGKWYLFYHDSSLSGGENHLRSAKIREIVYDGEGKIHLAEPQPQIKPPAARLEEGGS
ncbi:glycoside hydrolase family 43 protein [Karstenula rhodostoma CBS 690.94]|uniref:Glycoside hydrolase family 43 protein n=1 Tax=Karstenula rhodostoma CBS 690.94 TaxID=1392251 RepID=A0A9P4PQ29_9PLEO|nr:glycoside hydrolase family 43 protein [Karstenula rhodostoma CBS 690.94]